MCFSALALALIIALLPAGLYLKTSNCARALVLLLGMSDWTDNDNNNKENEDFSPQRRKCARTCPASKVAVKDYFAESISDVEYMPKMTK